jgi:hypothetical protein
MSAPFTIAAYDLQDIGARGNGSVAVQVAGYWSSDAIRLYIRREWNFHIGDESAFEWRAELSHSSGGREANPTKGGIKCDLEAETNFGAALIAIAATGRAIMAQVATLEAAYQQQAVISKAQEEAAKAARQALIDADPAIGADVVKVKIESALALLKVPGAPVCGQYAMNFLPRGEEQTGYNVCTLTIMWNGHTKRATFRFNGNAVAIKDAATLCGVLSARAVKLAA